MQGTEWVLPEGVRKKKWDLPPRSPVIELEGMSLINLCGESCLCLPVEVSPDACDWSGAVQRVASLVSRMKPGCLGVSLHLDLETALGEAVGSGPSAERIVLLADEGVRSELVEACLAGRENVEFSFFRHCDAGDCAAKLKGRNSGNQRLFVLTEAVFGADGRVAPLDDLAGTAARGGAGLVVDDTFGFGVLGPHGSGTVRHYSSYENVAVEVAWAGCSFGVPVAYCAKFGQSRNAGDLHGVATAELSRRAAALEKAVETLGRDSTAVEKVWEATRYLREGLNAFWLDTGDTHSPITPIVIGDRNLARRAAAMLLDRGVLVHLVNSPVLAHGAYGLRATVCADHTADQLEKAITEIVGTARELGLMVAGPCA